MLAFLQSYLVSNFRCFSIKKSILLADPNPSCHALNAFNLLTMVFLVEEEKPHRTDVEIKALIFSIIIAIMKSPDSGAGLPGFPNEMLLSSAV